MDSTFQNLFSEIAAMFSSYVPNLAAGIVLIAVGIALGWIAKRVATQTLAAFRIDRVFRRFKWGGSFAKADVRYAFLTFAGDVVYFVVFMILLKKALEVLQLPVLSSILERGMLFFPKLFASAILFGLGWLLAGSMSGLVQRALVREAIPRATLLAQFVKAVIVLFCAAMALLGLDIAREIVIIGFSVVMVTLGLLTVILAVIGGKTLVSKIADSRDE